jgi:hypothetical protein
VTEGIVEVLPRSGAMGRRVAAGERMDVRMDDGDESERAVRAALEAKLALSGVPSEDALADGEASEADAIAIENDSAARAATRKLSAARKLLRQGRHVAARTRLQRLAGDADLPIRLRAEALTLTAESYTAQGNIPRARKAYERADQIAPSQAAGHNARFALARLLERFTHDRGAAARAYEHYLQRAPSGALASQARQALCRLGRADHCSL